MNVRTHTTSNPLEPPRRRRRARRPLVIAFLALALALVLPLISARAAGPPEFNQELKEELVFSTRVHMEDKVATGGLEMTWRGEYITDQALKEAEAKKEAPKWIVANTVTTVLNFEGSFSLVEEVFLGTTQTGLPSESALRHLAPGTAYDARFSAVNSNKEEAKSKVFPFTTAATAKPQIERPEAIEPSPNNPNLLGGAASPTTAGFRTQVETNGAESKYEFSYAPEEAGHAPPENSPTWKPFTSSATGVVTVAEDFAAPEAKLTGLAPEATYFARVRASNEKGAAVELVPFTTPSARPTVFVDEQVRNVTGVSATAQALITPRQSETHWRFESATSASGPWSAVPGAEGVISQAQAEALPGSNGATVLGRLSGLKPSSVYYVRVFAENAAGEGRNGFGEPILTEKQGFVSFNTFGPPAASTLAVHALHGEALRIMGSVNPDSIPTSGEQTITLEGAPTGGTFTLTFKEQTTAPIAFNAPAEGEDSVEHALQALSSIGGDIGVTGPEGGPYTVFFRDRNGRVSEPQIAADPSELTPAGTVNVVMLQQGGEAYDTHYHFEYVSQKQFDQGGFANATATPPVDLGSGNANDYVGADLPPLEPGETYRFRIVATSTSPGNPVIDGEEQSLTVPVPPAPSSEEPCANQALRTGLSAHLPGCRAYEQLTPVDKGGALEIFPDSGTTTALARPGQDGNHLEYQQDTLKWGSGAGAGGSPYFFSRTDGGWSTTAAAAQPQAGVFRYNPQLFSPDLGAFAFEAQWTTSPLASSPSIEYEAGPPGGPYTTVASMPRTPQLDEESPFHGWVAASKDLSKLVLQVPDHTLLGHSTHTAQGTDLYEYSRGDLRQVNVTGPPPGVTVGTCGASIAGGVDRNVVASSHAVSDDGSHVFFEAVPTGEACSEPKHVYERVNGGGEGAETVDLGPYRFLAADTSGTSTLLKKPSGENPGLYLYKTGSAPEFLPSSGVLADVAKGLAVSEDLSTVYTMGSGALYRYDVPARKLLFVARISVDNERNFYETSPDGRYFYFIAAEVAGLPGGATEHNPAGGVRTASQVYRYDSDEALVQCMSCASSFDPEPTLSALFTDVYARTIASTDGDRVFFDTPAALVPADVNGEVVPPGGHYSSSSDVYEWRRAGVGGCSHVQGCVALVTSGHGSDRNLISLLGTTPSGRDVFFTTKESLVPSDNDTANDIYDARVGGGFPEPARTVECVGDACSPPFAPPTDLTPSSATFQGAGNLLVPAFSGNPPPPRHTVKCPKGKKLVKDRRTHRVRCVRARKAPRHARRATTTKPKGHDSRRGA
jgi:hypothetical protein